MMINISMPEISPNFTVDDIHKIREWNYERRKGMSAKEIIDDINRGAEVTLQAIEAARKAKQ